MSLEEYQGILELGHGQAVTSLSRRGKIATFKPARHLISWSSFVYHHHQQ
jgi:hypothetical protein